MKKKISGFLMMLLALTMSAGLASCDKQIAHEDNPSESEQEIARIAELKEMIENAREEGSVVTFIYTLNGVERVATFKRIGNEFVLQTPADKLADGNLKGDIMPYITILGENEGPDPNDIEWDEDEEHWVEGYGPEDEIEDDDDIEEDWFEENWMDEEDDNGDDDEDDDDDDGDEDDDGEGIWFNWDEKEDADWADWNQETGHSARALIRTRVLNNGGILVGGVRQISTGNDLLQAQINIATGVCNNALGGLGDMNGNTVSFDRLAVNNRLAPLTLSGNSTGPGSLEPKTMIATSITLNRSNKSITKLYEGKVITIQATVTPNNVSDDCIKMTISNGKYATVTVPKKSINSAHAIYSCKVTGIHAGDVTFTCGQEDGLSTSCPIRVTGVKGVSIDKTKITLSVDGAPLQLRATVKPDKAKVKDVIWSSNNPAIATVDQNGLVTAHAMGNVKITVITKDNNKKSSRSIKVTAPTPAIKVKGVTLNTSKLEFTSGQTSQLTYRIDPLNATKKDVIWWSNNEAVATVDQNGKVEAISEGEAKINIVSIYSGKTACCKVLVKAPDATVKYVTGVTLSPASVTLTKGEAAQLTTTIAPSDATTNAYTYFTSNMSVAKLKKGAVIAVGPGKATIMVTTLDGGKTATCEVTVNALSTIDATFGEVDW